MKAVIFDFDGTLANTLPICFYAFQEVFNKYDNRELTSEEIKQMFGPSETGIIKENLVSPKKEEAIAFFYKKYSEFHKDLVDENLEINKLLMTLKESGVKLGIFTGKAKRSLVISLKALGMEEFFDVMITGDDVINPKPHPEGLLKALEHLNVETSEAIYVGDSDADIIAGMQADVFTVGVQWLPVYQTTEFGVAPHLIVKSVEEFKRSLEVHAL